MAPTCQHDAFHLPTRAIVMPHASKIYAHETTLHKHLPHIECFTLIIWIPCSSAPSWTKVALCGQGLWSEKRCLYQITLSNKQLLHLWEQGGTAHVAFTSIKMCVSSLCYSQCIYIHRMLLNLSKIGDSKQNGHFWWTWFIAVATPKISPINFKIFALEHTVQLQNQSQSVLKVCPFCRLAPFSRYVSSRYIASDVGDYYFETGWSSQATSTPKLQCVPVVKDIYQWELLVIRAYW